MKKVMLVFGTRPEAIKLCPLAIEFKKYFYKFNTIVCVTAQHREMLDQVLSIFNVIPEYDLNLMKDNQTLFDITSTALIETGKIIEREKPDIVLVQGDTTTTFSASLAAYYHHMKVGHVEAGLRTGEKYSPFPEELNRKLTGSIADIHFVPTVRNKEALLSEGVSEETIILTGNTVIDALLWVREKIKFEKKKFKELNGINFEKKIILVTGHRRENFGEEFISICSALKEIAERNNGVEIVYPVHLNPNVKKPVHKILSKIKNIKLIEPLEYEPFVYLMDKSYFIISDSGGIQEEAPSLGKPILVTRNTTERPEAITAGAAMLVGTNKQKIVAEAEMLLNEYSSYIKMSNVKNPFGDGSACKKIMEGVLRFLNQKEADIEILQKDTVNI
jgi:UDP-N-acetylglucosamine 2-epimerase (non-hydrolysing)